MGSHVIRPVRLLVLGLLAALALTAPSSTAAPQAASAEQLGSISISASRTVLLLGQRTVLKGVVRPREAGVRLALQQRVDEGWKNLARKRTSDRGRYRFRVEPAVGGVFRYRVMRLPWLRSGNVKSETVRVKVYRWRNVNDLDIVAYDGVAAFDAPAAIAGTTYPRSIVLDADAIAEDQDAPGFFVVETPTRCVALDTTVGALDGNSEGTEVDVRITGDGAVLAESSYEVGESERLTLDIRGDSRVRVDSVTVEEDVERNVGVGRPRLLCAS